jgi:hypothetical protein
MEEGKNCLKMAMRSVWAGPVLGCFWLVADDRMIQMSPATHHMSCMDPYKTDTDKFQQIQPIRSMEEGKNCLKMAMLSVWAGPILGCSWLVTDAENGHAVCVGWGWAHPGLFLACC